MGIVLFMPVFVLWLVNWQPKYGGNPFNLGLYATAAYDFNLTSDEG